MYNIEDFFILFEFFDDNKDVISSDVDEDERDLIFTEITRNLDQQLVQISVDTKLQVLEYFKSALDQPAYNSVDYNKLRRLVIDWYSVHKSLSSLQKHTSDVNVIPHPLLDESIKSLGFDYSNLIYHKPTKGQFLLALANLYKIKGSPQSILTAIRFFGFIDVSLYEWWIVERNGDLEFEGRRVTVETTDETKFPRRRLLTYDEFLEFDDPHWFYTENQIKTLNMDSEVGLLGLPSITPYFSVATVSNLTEIEKIYLIVSRIIGDQFTNFIHGDVVPKDIYLDFAAIDVSLLGLYCGILYSYWMYSDYIKYDALRNYIILNFGITPELDSTPFVFSQPYAYEKLLYWTLVRRDEDGNHDPLDITSSGKIVLISPKYQTIADLPLIASYPDRALVYQGVSGHPEIYEYDGTAWNLIETLTAGLSVSKQPYTGNPFVLFPNTLEKYITEVDISGGLDDLGELDWDASIIHFDEKLFYPFLMGLQDIPLGLNYLYLTNITFPEYTIPIYQNDDLFNAVTDNLAEFDTIVSRPTSRDDAKIKLDQYEEKFSRCQQLNFTQNQLDPGRILRGNDPLATYSNLPVTATIGDTYLINVGLSGDPEVYSYTTTGWKIVENGLLISNLGHDNDFIEWLDSQVGDNPAKYINLVEELMRELDIYTNTLIGTVPSIELTRLFLGILDFKNTIGRVIDFFKPKKARMLSFDLIYSLENELADSINLDSKVTTTISIDPTGYSIDTIRGKIPENYDEYEPGYDYPYVYDEVDIEIVDTHYEYEPVDDDVDFPMPFAEYEECPP